MKYSSEENVLMLVSLLKAYGIRQVIASPGTTNLTFVGSLQHDPFFKIYSAPEERSAAYMAVGMAEESGEPVVITCTGATASRNYYPGLTEAYYRKLPVIAVTATQHLSQVGNLVPQVIDRSATAPDICTYSAFIGEVKDKEDRYRNMILLNEAMHHLRMGGGGPVHLNLETSYSGDFSVETLPQVRKIGYFTPQDDLPQMPKGKVGIYVGSHTRFGAGLTEAIEGFCEAYGAAVFCDNTSNYQGKYRVQYPLLMMQDDWTSEMMPLDTLIHIGEVSGAYARPGCRQIWRVSEDGMIRDPYKALTEVFHMPEEVFFRAYASIVKEKAENSGLMASVMESEREELESLIPMETLPFSHIWAAKRLAALAPEAGVFNFGILNSLRSWNFFRLPAGCMTYSNVGGFGIDGPTSTAIGGALARPELMHWLIVGDLAFFYDLNSLGNRHLPGNLRIILVNNGLGTEFSNYNHPAHKFGAEGRKYMAAEGHYGRKSRDLVRHYSQDLGIDYRKAENKGELEDAATWIMDSGEKGSPRLLEIFTDPENESDALYTVRHLARKNSVVLINGIKARLRRLLPASAIDALKSLKRK